MATRILIEYESMSTHFFGDSYEFPYLLTIEETFRYWFFWKRKRTYQTTYTVSMFQSLKKHHDHWDELIATKKQIK